MISVAFDNWHILANPRAEDKVRIVQENEDVQIYVQWSRGVVFLCHSNGQREYIPIARCYSILTDEEI